MSIENDLVLTGSVPSNPLGRRGEWSRLPIQLPPTDKLERILGVVPRETKVSRILDDRRCPELNRSRTLRIEPFPTEHSVRGDAMHMMAAGRTRRQAKKFVGTRLRRLSEEDREVIVDDAERMAKNANAFDDIPAAPENVEQQLWTVVDGWRIWTKSDRACIVTEDQLKALAARLNLVDLARLLESKPRRRNRSRRQREDTGSRQILLVRDLKTTKRVRSWHWFGIRLHAILAKRAKNWRGPVLLSIHPTQDDGTPPQFKWLTPRMEEQSMVRLRHTLWNMDISWKAEIKRLRELFLQHPDCTPEMAAAIEADFWSVLISRGHRRILLEDPVTETNPFRGDAGRHCLDCRRQFKCPVGTAWLDAHPNLQSKPLPPLPAVTGAQTKMWVELRRFVMAWATAVL